MSASSKKDEPGVHAKDPQITGIDLISFRCETWILPNHWLLDCACSLWDLNEFRAIKIAASFSNSMFKPFLLPEKKKCLPNGSELSVTIAYVSRRGRKHTVYDKPCASNELLPHLKPEMPPLSPAKRLTWQCKGMPFLCQFLKPHLSNFSWVLFEVSQTSFAIVLSVQLIDCSFLSCI